LKKIARHKKKQIISLVNGFADFF